MILGKLNIKLICPDGKQRSLVCEIHGRGGTHSPETFIYYDQGKRITPYAYNKLGYRIASLNELFKLHYHTTVHALVADGSAFLKMIPKVNPVGGSYPIPLIRDGE